MGVAARLNMCTGGVPVPAPVLGPERTRPEALAILVKPFREMWMPVERMAPIFVSGPDDCC